MFPKDELHQWLLGVLGDHIIPAIVFKYDSLLRREDLRKQNHQPYFSDANVKDVWKRLTNRLENLKADQSMVTVTPKFTASIMDLYVNNNNKIRLTGDRMRILQLVIVHIFRDLIKPEVNLQILSSLV